MDLWILAQLNNVMDSFLESFDPAMQEVLVRHLDRLQDSGNGNERPYTAPLGGGKYELLGRCGRVRARLIFIYDPNVRKRIIFVHACLKKGRRLRKQDQETMDRNIKIAVKGSGKIDELN